MASEIEDIEDIVAGRQDMEAAIVDASTWIEEQINRLNTNQRAAFGITEVQ